MLKWVNVTELFYASKSLQMKTIVLLLLVVFFVFAPANGQQTCKAGGQSDSLGTICCPAECTVCGGRGCGGAYAGAVRGWGTNLIP